MDPSMNGESATRNNTVRHEEEQDPEPYLEGIYRERQLKNDRKKGKRKEELRLLAEQMEAKKETCQIKSVIFKEKVNQRRKEIESILWHYEPELLMHRLSTHYYKVRAKYFIFLPTLLVSTAVSFCAFLASSDEKINAIMSGNASSEKPINITESANSDDSIGRNLEDVNVERVRELLTLAAGVLGILSTFLTSLGKYNNYQSNADMHEAAEESMSNMVDRIRADLISFRRKVDYVKHDCLLDDSDRDGKGPEHSIKDLLEGAVGDLREYGNSFRTIKESCHSSFPSQIELSFRELRVGFEPATHNDERYLYTRSYNALWRKIQENPFFPLLVPTIDIKKFCDEELAAFRSNNKVAEGSSEEDGAPPDEPQVAVVDGSPEEQGDQADESPV